VDWDTKFTFYLAVFFVSIILLAINCGLLRNTQNVLNWIFCISSWALFIVSSFCAFVKDIGDSS
jgi:glucan phosphoethanolaminetransferase (alkaline phosphatase superfamily)